MKLSVRLAGLCGSAAFIITALPGFYQQAKPTDFAQMATDILPGINIIENMLMSLGGALGAGFIGYSIGDILSNPKGKKKGKMPKSQKGMESSEEKDTPGNVKKIAQISASHLSNSSEETEASLSETLMADDTVLQEEV
jgi:hypothetical protein